MVAVMASVVVTMFTVADTALTVAVMVTALLQVTEHQAPMAAKLPVDVTKVATVARVEISPKSSIC